jgi:HK97 family phage major capsid protein
MAGTYGTHIGRTTTGSDPLVPEPLAASIIEEAPTQSAALQLMNKTQLSSKTQRMPVLDVLPMAYWVGGDTGLKQTTMQQWKNIVMVVEEIACIVPIPEAYLDDADIPLWDQVRPRITEAVGGLIDSAVLWGINKPTTWGEAVFPGATKSGQVIVQGTGVDLAQDVSNLGVMMAQSGYTVDGFAAQPGMSWQLVGMRNAQGSPIYQPNLQGTPGGSLYGYDLAEIKNGSWVTGPTGAVLLAGDFDKSIIGIRNDISFKMFTEGVVSDDTGKVILNLMQQDAVAMRMTMRLAYATVNPVTIMHPGVGLTARWPFAAILPVGVTPPATGAINVIQAPPYPYVGSYNLEGEPATAEDMMLENEQDDLAQIQREAAQAYQQDEREGRQQVRSRRGQRQQEVERGQQGEQGQRETQQVEQRGTERDKRQRPQQ